MIFQVFNLVLAFSLMALFQFEAVANDSIELAGRWIVKLDPDERGEKESWQRGLSGTAIEIPGICTEVGLGKPLDVDMRDQSKVFQHLHQRHSYLGAAWYQRDFEIPKEFDVSGAALSIERVLWQSKVWINGVPIGSQSSLSTAHQFSTNGALRIGKNQIVVCVDNRQQVPMGTLSHAYTQQTQTIWNGMLGRIQIMPKPKISIAHLSVTPDARDDVVNATVQISNRTSDPIWLPVKIGLKRLEEAETKSVTTIDLEIPVGTHAFNVNLPVNGLSLWSEFSPTLYEVSCEVGDDRAAISTGFRTLEAKDSQIQINGQRSFMRGTLDCCIFPRTGYPPTDVAAWRRQLSIAKSYGLNHIRFHSWCPPEAAFAAADELGIYLHVELPNWTDDMGEDESVTRFFYAEGERIFRSYAHHPSFMFFSLGNELKGNFKLVDQMLNDFKSQANHILMTGTSYSFAKRGSQPGVHDQFFITQRSKSGWVRGQGFFNRNRPETDSDFRDGVDSVSVPLISHEIGQYSVFPNVEEIDKYDGNLRSLALESIRNDLNLKNRPGDARLATGNSGKLALTLYKEEIERAIRTPGQDGFQLLGLTDFSGQSTATVGVLDAFWDSKGLIEPAQFRNFCSSTVPLLRLGKRCFTASETMAARVQVGHFGPEPLVGTSWQVAIKLND
ncbi:MAG: sugar-binding domain-containing protein, partial [Planctomycetota bacterium]